MLPKVVDVNASILAPAMALHQPQAIGAKKPAKQSLLVDDDDDDEEVPQRFSVTAGKDEKNKFQVDLQAFQQKEYAKACSCGMTSSSWVSYPRAAHEAPVACCRHTHRQRTTRVATGATRAPASRRACTHACVRCCSQWVCKHFKRCVRVAKKRWYKFVKPWQRPSAWQRAAGDAWEPIDFREIADATRSLARRGTLLRLKEPNVLITRKGAPTKNETGDMQERAKSFLESLGAESLAAEETRKVMAGASGAKHQL